MIHPDFPDQAVKRVEELERQQRMLTPKTVTVDVGITCEAIVLEDSDVPSTAPPSVEHVLPFKLIATGTVVSAKKKATKARIKTKATTLPSSPEAQVSFADHPDPPSGFTFLLACIAGCRADEVIGDANEQYYKLVARMGIEKGRWWYRVYVVKTFAGRVPGLVMRIALLHKLLGLFTSIS